MECLEMEHKVYTPIDKTTGALMGTRVHEPLQVTKMTDNATPAIFEHVCTGAMLTSVKLHFFQITPQGKELEYYTVTLTNAQVIEVSPVMYNTRSAEFEKMPHLEVVKFGYQTITWTENKDNIDFEDDYRTDNA
jgi:type VI secretion system secreted protein Hcp